MRLNNTLNDYLNLKKLVQSPVKNICPGHLFAKEYKRIQDLEDQMTARYQTLYSKIKDQIGLILLGDRIYQRLESRLDQANRTENEDSICQIETELDLRRQKILDDLLKQYGYSAHRHHLLRQAKINLMAQRVNRLYPLMASVLSDLSLHYRSLRHDLIGCNSTQVQQDLKDLLEKFRKDQISAASLVREHINNQSRSERERLYKIALACSHQFLPDKSDYYLKNMKSEQLIAEILKIIIRPDQQASYPEISLPQGTDITLTARQSMSIIETVFPEILANSLAFLKYRTIGKPVQFLSEIDFRYRPGDLFKDGHFFDPACGRIHYQGTLPLVRQNDYAYATGADVLGMGIEAFLKDPEKFIRTDEPFFNFIFGNLSGDLNRLTDQILAPPDWIKENAANDL